MGVCVLVTLDFPLGTATIWRFGCQELQSTAKSPLVVTRDNSKHRGWAYDTDRPRLLPNQTMVGRRKSKRSRSLNSVTQSMAVALLLVGRLWQYWKTINALTEVL